MMDGNYKRTQRTVKRELSPSREENEKWPKRSRNLAGPSGEMSIHVLFRNQRSVGSVIGKGGASIEEIRNKCNVAFSISKVQDSQEQLGGLKGSPEGIQQALVMCAQIVAQAFDEDKKSITLLVENRNVGSLLGVKGARVKEIRARTRCRIFISPQTLGNSTQNVIEISGEKFDDAIESVVEALSKVNEPVRILYTPGNSTMGVPWKGGGRGGGPGPMLRGAGPGPQPMPDNQWRGSHPLLEGPWREEMKNMWGSNRRPLDPAMRGDMRGANGFSSQFIRPSSAAINRLEMMSEAGPGRPFNGPGPMAYRGFGVLEKRRPMAVAPHFREERILYVPSDIVSTIIGKGGAKIKRIRQMSRAKIFIDKRGEGGEVEDQKITISGDRDRIEIATSMLNEFAGGNVPPY